MKTAAPSHRQSGRAGIIAIVVVLLIILATMSSTWFDPDPTTGKAPIVTTLNQAKDAACMANRMSLRTNFVAWRTTNPGVAPDQNLLQTVLQAVPCPEGGDYLFGTDDQVYCTRHFPPPAAMLSGMITLMKGAAAAQANAAPTAALPTGPIVPNLKLTEDAPAPIAVSTPAPAAPAPGATPAAPVPPAPLMPGLAQ